MAEQESAAALTFYETTFEVVDRDGSPWIRSSQVGDALGYRKEARIAIDKLFKAHAAEFTPSMTALVRLPTAGGMQDVRIFSPRGVWMLGMFARTPRAAEFRKWVLDVLERQAGPTAELPAPAAELSLTPRQADVLGLLLKGLPNKLIAAELGVAVETVKDHVAALLRAFKVSSRLQAVVAAASRQPVQPVQRALPAPEPAQAPALPAPEPAPALVALPPVDTAAIQLERVTAERDIMRRLLGDRLLKDKPHYRHVVRYFKIPGLTHVERARLMGWKTPGQFYDALRELSACGIIDYQPDPQKQAMGRRRVDALRREGRAGSGDHLGVSPEGMAAARKARSERLAKIRKEMGHV